jgi:hypothetical protein
MGKKDRKKNISCLKPSCEFIFGKIDSDFDDVPRSNPCSVLEGRDQLDILRPANNPSRRSMPSYTHDKSDENNPLITKHFENVNDETTEVTGTELIYSEATNFLRCIELGTQNIQNNTDLNTNSLDKGSKTTSSSNESGTVRSCENWIDSLVDEYGGYSSPQIELSGKTEKKKLNQSLNNLEDIDFLKENSIGCGLGQTLKFLRDRGLVNKDVEWAGRSMDKKSIPHHLLVKDAFFSEEGKNHGQIQRIEAALRRTDKYGRVLTAKEAFRELCYHFHGKYPSKNRQKKLTKQYIMDLAGKHKLTTLYSSMQIEKILEIRQIRQSSYIVIKDNIKTKQL